MIVAVTGANGLVGSAIVDKLNDGKIDVRRVVRPETDILDMSALMKAFEGVDVVVHAAGFVSFNPRDKRKLLTVNVEGTKNVVNACLAAGVKKIIHISSVAALGSPSRGTSAEQGRHRSGIQVNEDTKWIQGMPVSDYAQSKYLAELEVYRGMEEGMIVSIVSPSVVLSAGDGVRSSSALFGYVWNQRKFYTEFNLNYVDARDVADIVTHLVREDHNGEKFIATAGTASLGTVLGEIALRFQKKAPSINVPIGLAKIAAVFEELRASVTRSEPMVTRQSATALREKLIFENEKVKRILGTKFQSLEKTLDWCCLEYKNKLGSL
jgi:nucleoside-diphosphate-sugar epimerase